MFYTPRTVLLWCFCELSWSNNTVDAGGIDTHTHHNTNKGGYRTGTDTTTTNHSLRREQPPSTIITKASCEHVKKIRITTSFFATTLANRRSSQHRVFLGSVSLNPLRTDPSLNDNEALFLSLDIMDSSSCSYLFVPNTTSEKKKCFI